MHTKGNELRLPWLPDIGHCPWKSLQRVVKTCKSKGAKMLTDLGRVARKYGRIPAPLSNYGKPLLVGISRGVIIPGFFERWCEMIPSNHRSTLGMTKVFIPLSAGPLVALRDPPHCLTKNRCVIF